MPNGTLFDVVVAIFGSTDDDDAPAVAILSASSNCVLLILSLCFLFAHMLVVGK
jgi:hypothetical protein